MSDYMLDARRPLVEGEDYINPIKGKPGHRTRQGLPEFESNHSKSEAEKKAKRTANSNDGTHKGPGIDHYIRYNDGALEYSNTDGQAWAPAVYHCRIRDRLLAKSKTCAADFYTHPRARGKRALDETAFLQSQKDWNLSRDDGWTGVEVLFEIDKERFNHDTPNPMSKVPWLYEDGCIVLDLDDHPLKAYESIPLTVSSKVEGELMEAIVRYDDRIGVGDFWARLPGICGNGPIFKKNTLTERRSRFRHADGVMSWGPARLGGKSIKNHLESCMSPAMKAANKTKGLRRFTKAEQEEAKKPNAGKHQQKAAGWAKKWRRQEERVRRRQNRRGTPSNGKLRVLRPRAAPQPIDLDGYGPLPFGGTTGPLGQHESQHLVPLVGASPNLPVELPATSYGNNSNTSPITNDQFAPYFVPSMSTYSPKSTLVEQELNPCEDLINWDGGESDEHMEWMT